VELYTSIFFDFDLEDLDEVECLDEEVGLLDLLAWRATSLTFKLFNLASSSPIFFLCWISLSISS
jgi:hypothetical protein